MWNGGYTEVLVGSNWRKTLSPDSSNTMLAMSPRNEVRSRQIMDLIIGSRRVSKASRMRFFKVKMFKIPVSPMTFSFIVGFTRNESRINCLAMGQRPQDRIVAVLAISSLCSISISNIGGNTLALVHQWSAMTDLLLIPSR